MKLRNKKTGEIWDIPHYNEITMDDGKNKYTYKSLAEVNENWEDYKQAEPLIKDEKVRKAVRAWAEANGIDETHYRSVKFDHSERRLTWIRTIIEFDSIEGLEELNDGREYTIAELCGEEK